MAIYSKSPKALLLDEMNRVNAAPIVLNENNCIVGKPAAIATTAEGYNTEVVVTGIQFRGYIGSVTFRYKRLDLALLFKNFKMMFDAPGISSVHTGLANINARYGLNFTTNDLNNQGFYDRLEFTVAAATGSLQYIGSAKAKYVNAGYRLNDVIYQRNLDTYNHPIDAADVLAGFRSGAMLGYGLDLTDEFNIVMAMDDGPMGTGVNFTSGSSAALLQTLVGMGFPSFDYSKATIATYAKGVVAAANPKYQSVAVITGIVDNNIKGPIYIHYNSL